MPVVHDKTTFRPAKTLAKLPTAAQKLALTELDAKSAPAKRDYPDAPDALAGNEIAVAHFGNLVRQLHPDDLNNLIVLEYITQAAMVWAKLKFVMDGLIDGSIPNTVAGSTGSPVRAPEFQTITAYQAYYQNLLFNAGLKGANKLSNDAKARAQAARAGRDEADASGPVLTGNVHKDKGIMGLLARAKRV